MWFSLPVGAAEWQVFVDTHTHSQSLGNNEKNNDGGSYETLCFVYVHLFIYLFILAMPGGLWSISSLTRDWTRALSSETLRVLTTGLSENSQNLIFL